MSSLSVNTPVRRREDSIATEIDGEVVVMSLSTGRTFGLDKRGSRIWALLAQPTTVDAVAQGLLPDYETTLETCRADVLRFVEDLLANQLVERPESSP